MREEDPRKEEEGKGGEEEKENGKRGIFLCMVVLSVCLISQLV